MVDVKTDLQVISESGLYCRINKQLHSVVFHTNLCHVSVVLVKLLYAMVHSETCSDCQCVALLQHVGVKINKLVDVRIPLPCVVTIANGMQAEVMFCAAKLLWPTRGRFWSLSISITQPAGSIKTFCQPICCLGTHSWFQSWGDRQHLLESVLPAHYQFCCASL